jgi:hypothetical protein
MTFTITTDGVACHTKAYTSDGHEISGITSIEIEPITNDGLVRTHLTFDMVKFGPPPAPAKPSVRDAFATVCNAIDVSTIEGRLVYGMMVQMLPYIESSTAEKI